MVGSVSVGGVRCGWLGRRGWLGKVGCGVWVVGGAWGGGGCVWRAAVWRIVPAVRRRDMTPPRGRFWCGGCWRVLFYPVAGRHARGAGMPHIKRVVGRVGNGGSGRPRTRAQRPAYAVSDHRERMYTFRQIVSAGAAWTPRPSCGRVHGCTTSPTELRIGEAFCRRSLAAVGKMARQFRFPGRGWSVGVSVGRSFVGALLWGAERRGDAAVLGGVTATRSGWAWVSRERSGGDVLAYSVTHRAREALGRFAGIAGYKACAGGVVCSFRRVFVCPSNKLRSSCGDVSS